ncbi:hypothetical protein QCA50_014187 [Cerrena zonata]|uniref:Uncharacterized protein n=1 Tax=Cerrena zonata TaxID=2478898 RepID=A0AAW0FYU1_9APHY
MSFGLWVHAWPPHDISVTISIGHTCDTRLSETLGLLFKLRAELQSFNLVTRPLINSRPLTLAEVNQALTF